MLEVRMQSRICNRMALDGIKIELQNRDAHSRFLTFKRKACMRDKRYRCIFIDFNFFHFCFNK